MKYQTVAVVLALMGLGFAAPAQGDAVYSSEASFLSQLQSGAYLEEFQSIGLDFVDSPRSFTDGTFSYDASATDGLYGVDVGIPAPALTTYTSSDALRITFTGSPVTAVGGFFGITNGGGVVAPGSVTIRLDDGTTVTSTSNDWNFVGFTSASPIAWLELPGSAAIQYSTVDHLYVGAAAVPEPSAIMLILSGLAGGLGLIARRSWRKQG